MPFLKFLSLIVYYTRNLPVIGFLYLTYYRLVVALFVILLHSKKAIIINTPIRTSNENGFLCGISDIDMLVVMDDADKATFPQDLFSVIELSCLFRKFFPVFQITLIPTINDLRLPGFHHLLSLNPGLQKDVFNVLRIKQDPLYDETSARLLYYKKGVMDFFCFVHKYLFSADNKAVCFGNIERAILKIMRNVYYGIGLCDKNVFNEHEFKNFGYFIRERFGLPLLAEKNILSSVEYYKSTEFFSKIFSFIQESTAIMPRYCDAVTEIDDLSLSQEDYAEQKIIKERFEGAIKFLMPLMPVSVDKIITLSTGLGVNEYIIIILLKDNQPPNANDCSKIKKAWELTLDQYRNLPNYMHWETPSPLISTPSVLDVYLFLHPWRRYSLYKLTSNQECLNSPFLKTPLKHFYLIHDFMAFSREIREYFIGPSDELKNFMNIYVYSIPAALNFIRHREILTSPSDIASRFQDTTHPHKLCYNKLTSIYEQVIHQNKKLNLKQKRSIFKDSMEYLYSSQEKINDYFLKSELPKYRLSENVFLLKSKKLESFN